MDNYRNGSNGTGGQGGNIFMLDPGAFHSSARNVTKGKKPSSRELKKLPYEVYQFEAAMAGFRTVKLPTFSSVQVIFDCGVKISGHPKHAHKSIGAMQEILSWLQNSGDGGPGKGGLALAEQKTLKEKAAKYIISLGPRVLDVSVNGSRSGVVNAVFRAIPVLMGACAYEASKDQPIIKERLDWGGEVIERPTSSQKKRVENYLRYIGKGIDFLLGGKATNVMTEEQTAEAHSLAEGFSELKGRMESEGKFRTPDMDKRVVQRRVAGVAPGF